MHAVVQLLRRVGNRGINETARSGLRPAGPAEGHVSRGRGAPQSRARESLGESVSRARQLPSSRSGPSSRCPAGRERSGGSGVSAGHAGRGPDTLNASYSGRCLNRAWPTLRRRQQRTSTWPPLRCSQRLGKPLTTITLWFVFTKKSLHQANQVYVR